jgi:hypothetical protein
MDNQMLANLIKGGGSIISYFIDSRPIKLEETTININEHTEQPQNKPAEAVKSSEKPVAVGVSNEETINYQRREISKELLLMEKHLQQRCKINGTACDCCKKHPMAIEALSQEALGMTGDEVFHEIAEWSKRVSPITTAEASSSGKYDEEYPKLAVQAREMRKKVMGTTDVLPLLEPNHQQMLKEAVDA